MLSQYYANNFSDHYQLYGDIVIVSINALEYIHGDRECEEELGKDKQLVMQTLCNNLEVFGRIIRKLEELKRKS